MYKNKKYTGWAFDVYPDRDRDYFEREIDKQLKAGANFIWIGHNNPGEVKANKVEPGLSYAVYEAYLDKNDPRNKIASDIISSQKKFLEVCLKKNISVVFPIGYQIQMGERWNSSHPNELRRDFEGNIINWGGISASFYSEQYQEDTRKFYKWINEEWIKPFKKIILMVNLSDEPFGGDYSKPAEKAFEKLTGLTFLKALSGTVEDKRKLGDFQSNYIVEYAKWSALAWSKICPDIPCTISFCGFHGREENTMPSIPALFKNTPENFHPTFDVYPRDGSCSDPITEDDVTMLIIFLRQIAYLSNNNQKPYWVWTTGNSWGLGQASKDKANISDCLANQFCAVSTALENGGLLKGIAVWNYNVRNQGLFDDPNPVIYDPEELFRRVTQMLKVLREEMESLANSRDRTVFCPYKAFRSPSYAIYLSRPYSDKLIGSSKKVVWVKSFDFSQMHFIAKDGDNLIADDSIDSILKYYKNKKTPYPNNLLFLSDGDEEINPEDKKTFKKLLTRASQIFIPGKVENLLIPFVEDKFELMSNITTYDCLPYELDEYSLENAFIKRMHSEIYTIPFGDIIMFYNLTGKTQRISIQKLKKDFVLYFISPKGNLKRKTTLDSLPKSRRSLELNHHEIAFLTNKENDLMNKLLNCFKRKVRRRKN